MQSFGLPGKSDSLSLHSSRDFRTSSDPPGVLSPPPLRLSAAPQRGSIPRSSLAAAIDGEASPR